MPFKSNVCLSPPRTCILCPRETTKWSHSTAYVNLNPKPILITTGLLPQRHYVHIKGTDPFPKINWLVGIVVCDHGQAI